MALKKWFSQIKNADFLIYFKTHENSRDIRHLKQNDWFRVQSLKSQLYGLQTLQAEYPDSLASALVVFVLLFFR
jgi:hypothetical protein